MQVRAVARGVRMSPRKAQLVVEAIRGRSAREAVAFLETSPKAASEVVLKVVRSALANAANNFSLNPERMVVVAATADKGPTLPRRFRPKARGQAGVIEKRVTHITVVVSNDVAPSASGYRRRPA
jgi:large subunit ribosomal protein L22